MDIVGVCVGRICTCLYKAVGEAICIAGGMRVLPIQNVGVPISVLATVVFVKQSMLHMVADQSFRV